MNVRQWLDWLFGKPAAAPPSPPVPPSAAGVLVTLNRERARRGLVPLLAHPALFAAAQGHAAWMARTQTLSHFGPGSTPYSRVQSAGYRGPAGEVCAEGQRTEAQVVSDWLADPPHADVVLKASWRFAGCGVAKAEDGRLYWCVDFGAPP